MLFIKVYKKSCDVVGVVKAGIAIFPGYVDHKTRIYKNIRQIQVFDMIVKPYKILVVVFVNIYPHADSCFQTQFLCENDIVDYSVERRLAAFQTTAAVMFFRSAVQSYLQ